MSMKLAIFNPTLLNVLGLLVGPPSCQQEAAVIQSFNCNRKHLSLSIALVGLSSLMFTFFNQLCKIIILTHLVEANSLSL